MTVIMANHWHLPPLPIPMQVKILGIMVSEDRADVAMLHEHVDIHENALGGWHVTAGRRVDRRRRS